MLRITLLTGAALFAALPAAARQLPNASRVNDAGMLGQVSYAEETLPSTEGTIEVGAQAATVADTFGMNPSSPLPANRWAGMSYDAAKTAVLTLDPIANPTLRASVRDLLVSGGEAPAGVGSPGEWLVIRAEALARIGLVKDAAELLGNLPASMHTPAIATKLFAWNILSGEKESACTADREKLANADLIGPYCDTVTGVPEKAQLELGIREEAGEPAPSWFLELLNALQYPDAKLSELPDPSQTDDAVLAMILSLPKDQLPESLGEQFSDAPYPASVYTAANTEDRAELLELGVATGSADASELLLAYQELAGEENANGEAAQRAKLVKAVLTAQGDPARAQAIADYFNAYADPTVPVAILKPVLEPWLPKVAASYQPSFPTLAANLQRAGKRDLAKPLMTAIDRQQGNSIVTFVLYETERLRTAPPAAMAGSGMTLPQVNLPPDPQDDDMRILSRFYALASAFGYRVPLATVERLGDYGVPVALAPAQPAASGSPAAALLQLAKTYGSANLAEADDTSLVSAVQELRGLSMDARARQFAADAILSLFR